MQALFEQMRTRDPLQAFRLHGLFALVDAAVSRAWRMVGEGSAAPQRDPFSRLNRLVLVQWVDPVADPRSSVLRATTVEMPRTPPVVIQDYAANETRENGFVTFLTMVTPARPARRR